MTTEFIRIICIDESDPLEYRILEDSNKGSVDEVNIFLKDNYSKHKGVGIRWLLLPATVTI